MQTHSNVANWERMVSLAVGGALVVAAVKRRRLLGPLGTTGLGLVGRGLAGYCPVNAAIGRDTRHSDTRDALSGSRGIKVRESVSINRPPEVLYDFWSHLGNLPRFMKDIERVDITSGRTSHWVLRGPGGIRVAWDAETINEIEPELIAWRSLPGAAVASAGSVRFDPADDGTTTVTVTMQYNPPGGKAGAAFAWLTGHGVSARLREDLDRLRQLMESSDARPRESTV